MTINIVFTGIRSDGSLNLEAVAGIVVTLVLLLILCTSTVGILGLIGTIMHACDDNVCMHL